MNFNRQFSRLHRLLIISSELSVMIESAHTMRDIIIRDHWYAKKVDIGCLILEYEFKLDKYEKKV